MNKKERIYTVLKGEIPDRIPTGFWMHFHPEDFYGEASVNTHLDFFEKTGTDICKVMTEWIYPCDNSIKSASDWHTLQSYDINASFIRKQSEIVKQIADRANEASIVATVHGVVASASHALLGIPKYDSIGKYAQLYHLRTNKDAITDAYSRITETLINLVQSCINAGAEGIYYAALGGEKDVFSDEEHAKYIAGYDKAVIEAAYSAGAKYVILHMCKPKVNIKRFIDYPCNVVNWGIEESGISLIEGKQFFPDKVILGGFNNHHGALINGDYDAIKKMVDMYADQFGGKNLILGSDCTLPTDLPYENIGKVVNACKEHLI